MTLAAPVESALTPVHSSPNKWSAAEVMRLYARTTDRFEADLAQYVNGSGGYVIARPDFLALFRPVQRANLEAWLPEPGAADAWYIRFLAGPNSLHALLGAMPYFLPWCCWHRNLRRPGGPVHQYRTELIVNKLRNKPWVADQEQH